MIVQRVRAGVHVPLLLAAVLVTVGGVSWWGSSFDDGHLWFPDPRGNVVLLPHLLVLLAAALRAPRAVGIVAASIGVAGAVVTVPLFGLGLVLLPGSGLLLAAVLATDAENSQGRR